MGFAQSQEGERRRRMGTEDPESRKRLFLETLEKRSWGSDSMHWKSALPRINYVTLGRTPL